MNAAALQQAQQSSLGGPPSTYPFTGATVTVASHNEPPCGGSNVVATSTGLAAFAAALVKAQQAARSVEKDSSNSFHRYKYASAEAIIDEARSALVAAGIACLSTGWRFVPAAADASPRREGRDGKPAPVVVGRVYVQYRVLHESGEWMQFEASTPVIPESGRPEDKAEATALTYNAGYFLRGLLMLPRVEEGSQVDDRDDRRPHHQAPTQARQMPTQHEGNQSREEEVRGLEDGLRRIGREGNMAGHDALVKRIASAGFQGPERERLLVACRDASAAIKHRVTASAEAQAAFGNGGGK